MYKCQEYLVRMEIVTLHLRFSVSGKLQLHACIGEPLHK